MDNFIATETLENEPKLAVIDEAIAAEVLKGILATSATRNFISHMAYALRCGHLCVTPSCPNPSDLWRRGEMEENQLSEESWDLWNQQLIRGAKELPAELIGKSIIRDGDRYYFQRYWLEETQLLNNCHRLVTEGKPFPIDLNLFQKRLDEAKNLLNEQKQAIKMVIQHPLSLLAGGPGTGKTYTVGVLLRLLWDCMPQSERDVFHIAIAAPTGKAASQLQGSLARALDGTAWKEKLIAKTLHSLLGVNAFSRDRRPRLNVNLLIIDESSMVDAKMMARLMSSIPSETHVLFVGDPDQLPAVEVGSIFADLIQALKNEGCYTCLKTCLRSELEGILFFADAVNRGDVDQVFTGMSKEGIAFEEHAFNYRDLQMLQREYGSYFEYPKDPQKALEMQKNFCLLSPLRRGLFGVDKINAFFLERKKSEVVPIIITGNAPDLDLFNGKLGVLVEGDAAYFIGNEGEIRSVSALVLPKYELAYCLSVHKSQGSEFSHVLFILPPRTEVFGRQVLYTGITRARRQVTIWGEKERVKKIVDYCPQRISGLAARLTNLINLSKNGKIKA